MVYNIYHMYQYMQVSSPRVATALYFNLRPAVTFKLANIPFPPSFKRGFQSSVIIGNLMVGLVFLGRLIYHFLVPHQIVKCDSF